MTISAKQLINFIEKNTTIEAFYNCVTESGTNFNYDIDSCGPWGVTALLKACSVGNLELASALINMGANVNVITISSPAQTPLYAAIEHGHFNIVKLLLNNGANLFHVYTVDPHECGYIIYALNKGQYKIADYLIRFISPTLTSLIANKCRYYPEYYAMVKAKVDKSISSPDLSIPQDCLDLIKLKLDETERKSIFEFHRQVKLKLVAGIKKFIANNDLETLTKILNHFSHFVQMNNIVFNLKDSATRVAAVEHGNLDMVKLLVKYGDCICESDHITRSSIPEAARAVGHHEIADYLEKLQRQRYQQLFVDAQQQTKRRTFKLGAFFDKNSTLFQNLTQHTSEKDAHKILSSVLTKM